MSRSKALLGIALIFVLGIVVGVALSIRVSMLRIRNLAAGTPAELAEVTVSRLNRNLRFTPDQSVKVRQIVLTAEEEIQAVQSRIAPEIDAITLRTQREIRTLLTPAQLPNLPQPHPTVGDTRNRSNR